MRSGGHGISMKNVLTQAFANLGRVPCWKWQISGVSLTYVTALTLFFALHLLFVSRSVCAETQTNSAQVYSSGQERLCLGFNPQKNKWGWAPPADGWFDCPPHYAFFGVTNPLGRPDAFAVEMYGNCCALPAADILTDDRLEAPSECPDGFIVTGIYLQGDPERRLPHPLRCTKVNSDNYVLGAAKPGVHWGLESAASFPWSERKRMRRDELPLAIRYGLMRETFESFTNAGCTGDPVGSLLAGKTDTKCSGFLWRELFLRGGPGGKSIMPLRMFPDCAGITDIFDKNAVCIPVDRR